VPDFDLTTMDGLFTAIATFDEVYLRRQGASIETVGGAVSQPAKGPSSGDVVGEFTGTFCGRCGDSRRMRLVADDDRCQRLNPRHIEGTRRTLEQLESDTDPVAFALAGPPPLFGATCLQCQTRLSLVVDAGPPAEVVVLGSRGSGLATQHTPAAVAYYLDQAYRARTRGAFTAATTMYRSALEQLLQEQGFNGRGLADRINAAIAGQPPWIERLDDELMNALRSLGNRAVHGSRGDLSAQAVFDRKVALDIEHLFLDVLQEIYELPVQRDARRQRFRDARER
jgi:Domain of unknown function (DUF4145)